ncbi:MAG: hypothetical protein OHK0053_15090 [Microscillaceae bacterium]
MRKTLLLIKTHTWTDLLVHLGLAIIVSTIIFLLFFNSYLPALTYHRETVTVPDVQGMGVDEVSAFLAARDLDFEIADSSYSKRHRPNVVISQSPMPGAKVKRSRKLRLSINPKTPPKVRMPKVVDMPFAEALRTLRNADLDLGRVKYKPYLGQNVILEQSIRGRTYTLEEILAGIEIPKGTKIDLLVGDGVGEKEFPVPDLVLLPLDEAEFVIKGHELILGTINYDYNSKREIGTVIKQSPPVYIGRAKTGVKPGSPMDDRERNMIRAGEIIDLWVAGNPAARPGDAVEEEMSEEERRYRDSINRNINERRYEDFEKYRKKQLGIDEEEEKKPKPKTQPKPEPSTPPKP